MIKYNLICKGCKSTFDSWFASSKEYDNLKRSKHINCHICSSFRVEKNLMSPSVLNSKKNQIRNVKNEKYTKVRKKLKEYQNFIKNNFEYVGENFAYEARSIHYDKKKSSKGIYGKATVKEVDELTEEGIETEIIPWVSEKDN